MNLIEISEQLKDVPDNFLMKEVQAPSGAYPSYLVVAEMGRRKRMRDTAMKERPQTTVAEDLTKPSPEQIMLASAAMQRQQQMPQQMPPQAQMMSQPTPRLNAGLMGTPQAAQELSAQDAMAAMPERQPVGMAGGGLVAFKEGGEIDDRGIVRFQPGGDVRYGMRFEDLPVYETPLAGSMGDLISNVFTRPGQRIDPVTGEPIYMAEFLRRQEAEKAAAARPAAQATVEQTMRNNPQAFINFAQSNPTGAIELAQRDPFFAQQLQTLSSGRLQNASAGPSSSNQMSNAQAASPTNIKRDVPQAPKVPLPTYTDPYRSNMQANLTAMQNLREPTAQEIAASRAAGVAEYERIVPDRTKPMEEQIAAMAKDTEGRRASNLNEALIQAGLGIMGSRSPYFMQAVGEGGTSALKGYREGMLAIRQGERDLLKSRTELANAQTLRDQNKFAAADKAEERGLNAYKRGMDRLNTESAIIARNQNAAYQQFQAEVTGAKLPAEIREMQARAGYYEQGGGRAGAAGKNVLSDADQKAAEESAQRRALMTPGVKFGTPEYQNLFNRIYQEEIQRRAAGVNYVAPSAGGGLPPGWSVNTR